jgi:hypothetical protein
MAEIAQRVLMNEFKQLSKEKWTNIEVSLSSPYPRSHPRSGNPHEEYLAKRLPADQREHL